MLVSFIALGGDCSRSYRGKVGERGYTLVEMVISVAIIAVIAVAVMPSLSQNPAEVSTTIGMVSTMIDEASALAFANAADAEAGRGATVQFTKDERTGETVARVYWGRPYSVFGGFVILAPEKNMPEMRTRVHIRVEVMGSLADPPFAIFISPSGHASAMQGYSIIGRQIFSENSCNEKFSIEFSLGNNVLQKNISCNYVKMLSF